ncbi:hypothetical protein ANTPLA_LOCUS6783 [Anthophora plagiata]
MTGNTLPAMVVRVGAVVAGTAGGWRFRQGHRGFRHTRIPGKLIQDQSRNNHRTHFQFLSSFSPPFTPIHPVPFPLPSWSTEGSTREGS